MTKYVTLVVATDRKGNVWVGYYEYDIKYDNVSVQVQCDTS